MHRFIWDLRSTTAAKDKDAEPDLADLYGYPHGEGTWMPAGKYTGKLTPNGQRYTQPLIVKPDPRQ